MIQPIKLLTEFNKAFSVPVNRKPTLISNEEFKLKINLIKEELNEYENACSEEDITEVCDAIVDLAYVMYGMVVQHGLSDVFDDMFEEVHKSNMSKLENGRVLTRSDGKIMKGSEYFTPDLNQFING
ncbi:MAG: putative phosphoribosyl-ATP pyrophosphohydrolase [Prokaryotic dsDNA virus sp.]|nr:MAG: putative phosphoribosyl-ATP pyrophosphohydrolase [Prokaryotic dsDNA virus sp.]|tara:strand:+ start:57 stop:437 length:381 start_codon:yes stop_codon:yes gene_type:complete